MTLEQYAERYGIDLTELVAWIEARSSHFSEEHKRRLSVVAGVTPAAYEPTSLQDVSIETEVLEQLKLIRRMRNEVAPGGFVDDVAGADRLLRVTNQTMQLLQKTLESLRNMDRLKKIEDAAVEAIKTLPPEAQDEFFGSLEQQLVRIT